jgi:hypothetical protein
VVFPSPTVAAGFGARLAAVLLKLSSSVAVPSIGPKSSSAILR